MYATTLFQRQSTSKQHLKAERTHNVDFQHPPDVHNVQTMLNGRQDKI